VFRLIEAFALSRRPDAHLVIVGKDKHRSRGAIGELARDRVPGALCGAQEDVRPWYGAADALRGQPLRPVSECGARGDGLRAACDYDAAMRHAELIEEGVNVMWWTLSTSVRLPTGSLAWMFLPLTRWGAGRASASKVQSHGHAEQLLAYRSLAPA